MYRLIYKDKPKEDVFKSIVKDFYRENPDVEVAVISISKNKPKRTELQNNLYWKWCTIIGGEIGYTKDEIHILLANKFLGRIEVHTKSGEIVSSVRSTKGLKVEEFTQYLNDIDMFSAEWSITLPRGEDYDNAMGRSNAGKISRS
jgi:hypothetical protein